MTCHCDVGNHDLAKGEDDYRCYHCKRSCCKAHMSNPDGLPGDLVACADHAEEVRQVEERLRTVRKMKQYASSATLSKQPE